jgi:uncharacterized protein
VKNDYYVYVYIDPRDYSEFYYGKGRGARKSAHLDDKTDTEKTRIISEIKRVGLDPIIRVIAKDLTEDQAFLIEKTLIWKLGKSLSNISTGMFSDKFRPMKSLYKELYGFDYYNGIYFFNCGDDGKNQRKWEDFREYGFITAGGAPKYSDPIRTFEIGDIACVYLSKFGYVGVGKVLSKAVIEDDFKISGQSIFEIDLAGGYEKNRSPKEDREYMCRVEWISSVERDRAYFERKSGLYSPVSVKASMQNQDYTIKKIEEYFDIDISKFLGN